MLARIVVIAAVAALFVGAAAHAEDAGAVSGGPEAHPAPAGLSIVTREEWGAAPANEALMREQNVQGIVIHHTATKQNAARTLEQKLRGLQGFSQRREQIGSRIKPPWGDIPYHFYIDVSGRVGEARPLRFSGDTNTNYDPINNAHIVVEGDFRTDRPSEAQLAALDALVDWLADRYEIPAEAIHRHDERASTICPGPNMTEPLRALLARRLGLETPQ